MSEKKPIIRCNPVFKQMVWGGTRLGSDFGYEIPGDSTGECWGIAAHKNGDATIETEEFKGETLRSLWEKRRDLFGNLSGEVFPLLIKIIDAKADLSIQVHPDDAYAAEHEDGSLGKMECWYIIDCPEDAELVVGHNATTREELADMIHNKKWDQFIRRIPIKKGDLIQIDPGTVHAITSGCLLLETQQNSDITYRVYDYDRLVDGKLRQLHVEQSIDVIQVPAKSVEDSKLHTQDLPKNQWNELIACKYYRIFKLTLDGEIAFKQTHPFLNLSVIEGEGTCNGETVKKGDHLILPCGFGDVKMTGKMTVIASTVNDK